MTPPGEHFARSAGGFCLGFGRPVRSTLLPPVVVSGTNAFDTWFPNDTDRSTIQSLASPPVDKTGTHVLLVLVVDVVAACSSRNSCRPGRLGHHWSRMPHRFQYHCCTGRSWLDRQGHCHLLREGLASKTTVAAFSWSQREFGGEIEWTVSDLVTYHNFTRMKSQTKAKSRARWSEMNFVMRSRYRD